MSQRTWKTEAERAADVKRERDEARAENRRLKRELQREKDAHAGTASSHVRLREENVAMRKALEPFAEYARRSDEVHGIRDTIEVCFGVTMADMRAARAALSHRPRTTNRARKAQRRKS